VAQTALSFRFETLDLRDIDSRLLLESPTSADNVLAILCAGGNSPLAIQRIMKAIGKKPINTQLDNFTKLIILAGLRSAEKIVIQEIKKMGFTIDLMENKIFRQVFKDGERKGFRKVKPLSCGSCKLASADCRNGRKKNSMEQTAPC